MQRIHAPVDAPTLAQIEEEVKKKGLSSRAQWLCFAIDYYLRLRGADPSEMAQEMAQLRTTIESLRRENQQLKEVSCDVEQLRSKLAQMEAHEAQVEAQLQKARLDAAGNADLKDELERQKAQYSQSLTEATQRWEELKGIRSENTKLKKRLEESQATIQHLKDDLLNRQSETDELAKTREELAVTRTERDKLQQSLTVRDEDVAWLRGHVAQLTQQLALPPSQEEARARSWWRFWR